MILKIDKTGSIEGLKSVVEKVLEAGAKTILILACDSNGYAPANIDRLLKDIPVPLCGGIFPAIVAGAKALRKGNIVLGFPMELDLLYLCDLDDGHIDHEAIIDERFSSISDIKTAFVFVDALSSGIQNLIGSLFNVFGLEINYVGAGAGPLNFKPKHCLFTNRGLARNGAIIAATKLKSGIGIAHGWQPMEGPFRVTEAKKNVLRSLDWKPAFEVYRNAVEQHAFTMLDRDHFSEIAISHPFGIAKLGAESIVRDPVMLRRDGSMVCAGDIPAGAFVDILQGDERLLLQAARTASEDSRRRMEGSAEKQVTLFIDCISRALYLRGSFHKELEQVFSPDRYMFGALTIGEIANNGNSYLEFHNKTTVVAQIETS